MLLKHFNELWGIPLEEVKKRGRKYKLYSMLIYAFNLIMIIICGVYMFNNGSSFTTCVFGTILITLISFMLLCLVINPEKWRAYLFYKKHKNIKVIESLIYLKEDNMRSILYCSNYKRKKEKGTISDYKELMISACCEDSIFAKRLGNLLYKFTEKSEDDMTELRVYFVKRGRHYFLIGFEDDI